MSLAFFVRYLQRLCRRRNVICNVVLAHLCAMPCYSQMMFVDEFSNSNRVMIALLSSESAMTDASTGKKTIVNPEIIMIRGDFVAFSNHNDTVRCILKNAKIMRCSCSEVDNSKKWSRPQLFDQGDFELDTDQRIYLNGVLLEAKLAPSRLLELPVEKRCQSSSDMSTNDFAKVCDMTVRQVLCRVNRFVDDGNVLFNEIPLTWQMLTVSSVTFPVKQTKGQILVTADIKCSSDKMALDLDSGSLELCLNHDGQVVRYRIVKRKNEVTV